MKKMICLILSIVCILTLAGCQNTADRSGTEVTGRILHYDSSAQVLLMSPQRGDRFALAIEPDSTITWENTEYFVNQGYPIPSEKDFEILEDFGFFIVNVTLGDKKADVSHKFIDDAEDCYSIDHIVVEAIEENLVDMPTATTAKPVIYLYPETETDVSVKLNYDGKLTCTYPAYENGWSVTAAPDGTLTDAKGQTYNYLYWEGITNPEYDFSQGFCVPGEDTAAFLEDALAKLGLTRREANEFIVYWLPLMEANPYNLISFQTDAYTDHAELEISPAPDTLIRVFMAWKPLEEAMEIPAQTLTAPERTGFTAVEWGGSQID